MDPEPRDREVERVERAAAWFRDRGYNPLASCGRLGHPPYSHRDLRDLGQSPRDFSARFAVASGQHRIEVPALQIALGAKAPGRIVAVDLDGSGMAREVWSDLTRFRNPPPTWEVDSHGGRHVYFRLPEGIAEAPWKCLWRLADGGTDDRGRPTYAKHEMIEFLGDGRLLMAPPSLRRKGDIDRRYAWAPGRSPREIPAPAECPEWLLAMPNLAREPRPEGGQLTRKPTTRLPNPERSTHYRYRDVLEAIPGGDRLELASSVVRFSGGCDAGREWCPCHTGPQDRTPSGSFSPLYGYYTEPGNGLRMSLFELLADRGAYPSPEAARDDLGDRYLGHARSLPSSLPRRSA